MGNFSVRLVFPIMLAAHQATSMRRALRACQLGAMPFSSGYARSSVDHACSPCVACTGASLNGFIISLIVDVLLIVTAIFACMKARGKPKDDSAA